MSPVVASTPFPTVEDCLIAARAVCNDMSISVAGNLLADNQPFVLPYADLCHKTMRKMLAREGVNAYFAYGYATGLTPVATPDPTTQVQLTYQGYYDGVAWHGPNVTAPTWSNAITYLQGQLVTYSGIYYIALANSGTNLNMEPDISPTFWAYFNAQGPVLPSNFLEPLEVWERATVTNGVNTGRWVPVIQAADSISTRSQTARFGIWDWASSILYLPGATQENDLKFKYMMATPRLTSLQSTVPIADCDMAMGALIAAMLALPRGGEDAAACQARAENEVMLLATPTAIKEEFAAHNRIPFRTTRAGRRR
jgi:hypothetical protein